jgi:hypothetical protein
MSADVTMQELELEQAELLPSRETLCHWRPCWQPCQSFHRCCDVKVIVIIEPSCWQ